MYETRHFEGPPSEMDLEAVAKVPCEIESFDHPVSVYGRGNLGKVAELFLRVVGQPTLQVFDQHSDFGQIRRAGQVAVAIVTSPYVPIAAALHGYVAGRVMPFYDLAYAFSGQHPLADNGWCADPFTDDDLTSIQSVWRRWDDNVSRAHHLQFIAWRRAREEWTFDGAPVSNNDRYFIPEVVSVLHDRETFLDAGAHEGETSVRFASVVGDRFNRIVMAEPDEHGQRFVSLLTKQERRQALPYALGARDGAAMFWGGFGYASRLSSRGDVAVKVRTIDTIDVAPTFIKLHLEGGELNALRGARQTLTRCRPVIAAAVYHNVDGLWWTAEWLMSHLEDYRFLFRNHCWCGAGAVVYAIPNVR
jgi:FkbM family methyltransferase